LEHAFWASDPFRNVAAVDQLNRVKLPLFLSLVLYRLGSDLEDPTEIFGDPFKIVPRVTQSDSSIPDIRVEPPGRTGIWELRKGPFKANDLKMSARDFYNWQTRGWREFRYYLSRIDEFPADPSLVGSQALVEVGHVDVLWDPPGILGLSIRPVSI